MSASAICVCMPYARWCIMRRLYVRRVYFIIKLKFAYIFCDRTGARSASTSSLLWLVAAISVIFLSRFDCALLPARIRDNKFDFACLIYAVVCVTMPCRTLRLIDIFATREGKFSQIFAFLFSAIPKRADSSRRTRRICMLLWSNVLRDLFFIFGWFEFNFYTSLLHHNGSAMRTKQRTVLKWWLCHGRPLNSAVNASLH